MPSLMSSSRISRKGCRRFSSSSRSRKQGVSAILWFLCLPFCIIVFSFSFNVVVVGVVLCLCCFFGGGWICIFVLLLFFCAFIFYFIFWGGGEKKLKSEGGMVQFVRRSLFLFVARGEGRLEKKGRGHSNQNAGMSLLLDVR